MKNNKKKKWIKKRHKVIRDILSVFFGPYIKLKYNIKIQKCREADNRPMLILYNHQTAYDQFFVGLAFKKPLYYVASEDIFSMGATSRLIKFLVEPIPIKKQTNDARAVINCIRVAKEGGSIAIAPEGNRTYSGKTEYIKPSIASLAKHLGLPIALFVIEDGYGVHPRWADKVRRGKMRAGVSRIIYPEEYMEMTDDALLEEIRLGLYRNEGAPSGVFKSAHLAEYLERAIYVCSDCGLSTFESHGDIIECKRCRKKARYTETKELCGVDCKFPFKYVNEWYDYQCSYVNSLDTLSFSDEPIYTEECDISEVILYDRKMPIKDGVKISLFKDKISVFGEGIDLTFDFASTGAVTVLGKNKLNVYFGGKVYQIVGSARFCALKYVNLYYRYQNQTKESENAEFLGL